MTPVALLVLALVVLALGVGFFVASAGRGAGRGQTQPDRPQEWFRSARAAVCDGDQLSRRIARCGDPVPTDLPDEAVDDIVSELKEFNAQIAAISATAPTAMDTRVCREVGVCGHALCDVFDREVRLRQAFGAEDRSTLAGDMSRDPRRRLQEFDIALRDLETHVELL